MIKGLFFFLMIIIVTIIIQLQENKQRKNIIVSLNEKGNIKLLPNILKRLLKTPDSFTPTLWIQFDDEDKYVQIGKVDNSIFIEFPFKEQIQFEEKVIMFCSMNNLSIVNNKEFDGDSFYESGDSIIIQLDGNSETLYNLLKGYICYVYAVNEDDQIIIEGDILAA